ncbi:UNVERIFIED_CONTAM: hypothetical protein FKN15_002161 [Acipenser sinensis]
MMTLAEQIIEATPERIKRENFVAMETTPLAERVDSAGVSNTMSWLASYLADVEQLPSVIHLRSMYSEPLTPSSNPSLSPASSPVSEGGFDKPTLPSAADWTEFLNASNNKVERELAQLTLSDPEQRELYEAARLVQTAFRKYKGRPLREQQEVAAAVIQRCYRKYKEMTQAAILIQSKFRSYHEQKKFQQSRRAAVLIQQYYRSYKELGRLQPCHRTAAAAALRTACQLALQGRKVMSHVLAQVVDIMRVNVDKVLERDQKLSELDDRADALQAGASQFETSAARLKRKYWWKNCKVQASNGFLCLKHATCMLSNH